MSNSLITPKDKDFLRHLGAKVLDVGNDPIMETRRREWKKLNSLQGERPMILIETQGVMDEVVPLDTLDCEGDWARMVERKLRDKLFFYNIAKDDTVIEPRIGYSRVVHVSDFGVQPIVHRGDNADKLASCSWEPVLKKLPEDLSKLHFRELRYDEEATLAEKARLEEVFEGILPVVNKDWYWWTHGLTMRAIHLMGLEQFMLAMYDQPEGLHQFMAFLRDEHAHMLDWFEESGLLTPNNEDHYIGSGSVGYTDELPQSDYHPSMPGRLKDMWGLSESQETVGVSAEMFDEFVFQYQFPLISRFGLSYYGCCEPVHGRWHIIKQIPNLRKVSVSPWCDEEKMADWLGRDYVYCRKPNPVHISTPKWDEDLIRNEIRKTIEVTRGMNVEIVMKDVHTVNNEPQRFGRWVEIVREVIHEYCT